MFIANLIENDKYYKYVSFNNPILPYVVLIIISFGELLFKDLKILGVDIVIWVIIVIIVYSIIIRIRINKFLNGSKFKIKSDHIIIESKKGDIVQDIDIKSVDKILVLPDYSIPKDSLKTFFKQLIGRIKKYYIIVEKDNKQQRFDIFMPSYYMGIELNKIIEDWKHRQDINIEYIK